MHRKPSRWGRAMVHVRLWRRYRKLKRKGLDYRGQHRVGTEVDTVEFVTVL